MHRKYRNKKRKTEEKEMRSVLMHQMKCFSMYQWIYTEIIINLQSTCNCTAVQIDSKKTERGREKLNGRYSQSLKERT